MNCKNFEIVHSTKKTIDFNISYILIEKKWFIITCCNFVSTNIYFPVITHLNFQLFICQICVWGVQNIPYHAFKCVQNGSNIEKMTPYTF